MQQRVMRMNEILTISPLFFAVIIMLLSVVLLLAYLFSPEDPTKKDKDIPTIVKGEKEK